nr:DNA mismatch repair endonuclease MutL [Halomarina sp. PSR21]
MATIERLDEATVARIAAGEVVTRPASVVKELVENSLDAGAGSVEVAVENAGLDLIRVTDDGHGMSREDAVLAVERHTTSKISGVDDVERVRTLGFRGEALPSIASVADLAVTTRAAGEGASGTRVTVGEGGTGVEAAGHAVGTTVEVRDLFDRVPARRESLGTPKREFARISDAVSRYALAHPDVRFRLTHDERTVLSAPGTGERVDALLAVYDRTVAGQSTELAAVEGGGDEASDDGDDGGGGGRDDRADGGDGEGRSDAPAVRVEGVACYPSVTRASPEHVYRAGRLRPARDRGQLRVRLDRYARCRGNGARAARVGRTRAGVPRHRLALARRADGARRAGDGDARTGRRLPGDERLPCRAVAAGRAHERLPLDARGAARPRRRPLRDARRLRRRTGAFDEMTRTVLSEAGETIANAINTVETQRTLLADRVTELELSIDEPDLFLRTLATHLGTRLVVDDIVNESGGASLVFLTAEDADAEALSSLADEFVTVERADVIAERDEGIRCELRLTGTTIASTLTDYGAITRELAADANGIRAVIELPYDADVREFVESIQATHPNTDLVARRNQTSSVQSERDVRAGVTERLTDRQYEVVRTAYASGFFEWPRDRTGQEVAASLDISQPTFNKHLRSAERKLFSMLLDD